MIQKLAIVLFVCLAPVFAQTVDPNLYAGIQWRLVGPFRGGKATMASGVPGNPAVYYFSTAGSGVWKTVDGGQVWNCVSDSVRLTGIGAVAVAPSRPDTVYVGASAATTAGLYRSTDGGGHWDLVALQGHAVSSIVIDPHNPDLVMAAAGRYRRDAHDRWRQDVEIGAARFAGGRGVAGLRPGRSDGTCTPARARSRQAGAVARRRRWRAGAALRR